MWQQCVVPGTEAWQQFIKLSPSPLHGRIGPWGPGTTPTYHDWTLGSSAAPTWPCALGLGTQSSMQGPGLFMHLEIWQQGRGAITPLPPHFQTPTDRMTWHHRLTLGCGLQTSTPGLDRSDSALSKGLN